MKTHVLGLPFWFLFKSSGKRTLKKSSPHFCHSCDLHTANRAAKYLKSKEFASAGSEIFDAITATSLATKPSAHRRGASEALAPGSELWKIFGKCPADRAGAFFFWTGRGDEGGSPFGVVGNRERKGVMAVWIGVSRKQSIWLSPNICFSDRRPALDLHV